MNTPITDAVAKLAFPDDAVDDYGGYVRMLEHARRLELDRSALMEALKQCLSSSFDGPLPNYAREAASTALATARANFPEP